MAFGAEDKDAMTLLVQNKHNGTTKLLKTLPVKVGLFEVLKNLSETVRFMLQAPLLASLVAVIYE